MQKIMHYNAKKKIQKIRKKTRPRIVKIEEETVEKRKMKLSKN